MKSCLVNKILNVGILLVGEVRAWATELTATNQRIKPASKGNGKQEIITTNTNILEIKTRLKR